LYYPASEQRKIMEPVETHGTVVRLRQRYSPLQWAQRDSERIESLRVPSAEEQREAFVEACSRFMQALIVRLLTIGETETARRSDQYRALLSLHRDVGRALVEATNTTHEAGQRPLQ
jgi:hypothetical protein